MNYSFIKIESENALIEAISKMHKFSVIGFSNNGKISRFCRIKNQWINSSKEDTIIWNYYF